MLYWGWCLGPLSSLCQVVVNCVKARPRPRTNIPGDYFRVLLTDSSQEQELKKQKELEKQLEKQRQLEMEREEERRKAMEQREVRCQSLCRTLLYS